MWTATLALNGLIGAGVPQDWSTHMLRHEITALHGLDHAQTVPLLQESWMIPNPTAGLHAGSQACGDWFYQTWPGLFSSCRITASVAFCRLSDSARWRGGHSFRLFMCSAMIPCAGTRVHIFWAKNLRPI